MSILDNFFKLGDKVTQGDPVRKAKFDYLLYWIVFLTFCSLSINYFYQFFFNNAGFSMLMWGIVIAIFCWFNYWGLVALRQVYQNMQEAGNTLANLKLKREEDKEDMGFKNAR